ncbi:TetR/AcrR family transcriptional regulator [Blastococcus goldschmidtiae]|uniref:TetR/AcrR family transcriptional regulator n=1 Tax=Blastococcus goldschmidtiae TaxID=3075546 RepID=A0ABU2K7V4_9ACTN|nr:TetR/AcrR family transcriptional regulator [Blastococcus sp. DSM 46792]MDT0276259.1 TetR/AcrR family transcriptional regulator [Blastococcus sp. DSM 46792]
MDDDTAGATAGRAGPAGDPRRPGRPRTEGLDERILQAALHLVDRDEPVTVRAVVALSGVSRTALYRRWPSMTDLVAAALDHGRTAAQIPVDGDIRQNIVDALFGDPRTTHGTTYSERRFRRRLVLGLENRVVQKASWRSHVERRRAGTVAVLQAAVDRGVLRADTDIEAAIDLINGVFYYQYVVRGCMFDDPAALARCREAFEIAWRGMAAS